MKRYRLGIWVSHPIQYYIPWFHYLAKQMDIEVFYAYRQNAKGQSEAGFGVEFEWDIPLFEGYSYRWLRNISPKPSLRSFGGCDTPEIYEIVQKKKFDAFLVFGWNRKSALQTILACRRNKIPILMRGDSNLLGDSRLKSALKYFPYRWLLPRLDAHLYVGKRNKAYLEYYGVSGNRLFSASHFVDSDFFSQSAKEAEREGKSEALRNQFGIPKGAFVFLFAGKMIPKKRPADFLQAGLKLFAQKEGAGVHLLFVGDGPLRPALESLAKSYPARIHFAGFQNQSQMPIFYRASDTLILPSNGDETWGLVVNEAFACEIPAIVSDAVGCAPDLIEEGRTGFTFPVGDLETLRQRMLELKDNCETRPEEIRQSLAQKTTEYSIERATRGLEEALESMKRAGSHQKLFAI